MQIKNIRLKDGTPCTSVKDAVEKFKCPGPCDPDCPLHPAKQIDGTDQYAHMCHDRIAAQYPLSVLDAMQCSYEAVIGEPAPEPMTYAAVIKASAVRDVQFAVRADADPLSDDWEDLHGAEIWLGFFSGPLALQNAAGYAGTANENIRLIPLPGQAPIREIVLEDAGSAGADCRNYGVKLPKGTTVRAFIEMVRQERKDESGMVYVSGNLAEASPSNHSVKWEYKNGCPVWNKDFPECEPGPIDRILDRKIRAAKASGGWGHMAWYLSLEPVEKKEGENDG